MKEVVFFGSTRAGSIGISDRMGAVRVMSVRMKVKYQLRGECE